jgi:polysaccharide pyruvyl transferase WcaK-like protein
MSRRILLLGTHGQQNIGDELLLSTFLSMLGSEHDYEINSYDPVATAAALDPAYDVDIFDTAAERLGLLRRIRRADVLFFAGGSIVKELTPATGRRRTSVLLMVLVLMTTARWFTRTPMLMSNIGVGPVSSRRGRFLAALILRQATLISVRDQASWTTCLELGVRRSRLVEMPDVVFANAPEGFEASGNRPRESAEPLRVALSLNHDVEDEDAWRVFLDRVGTALREVDQRSGLELVALPMQSGFKDDHDLAVLEDFVTDQGLRCRFEPVADHHDVARIIAQADVVVAERLHAVVISTILGTPVVPLPYNIKVTELADGLGLAPVSFPVDQYLDPLALAAAVSTLVACPDEGGRLQTAAASRRRDLDAYAVAVRAWIAAPSSSWSAAGFAADAR